MTQKITLRLASFIALSLLLNVTVNAQRVSAQQQTPGSKSETVIKKQEVKEKPSMPYYNYKGIQDLELAKKEWVKDHPQEYRALVNQSGEQPAEPFINYKGIKDLKEAKTEWLKDHPQVSPAPTSKNVTAVQKQEPFVNYKGITDLKQAKLEWLKDHPQTTNNNK